MHVTQISQVTITWQKYLDKKLISNRAEVRMGLLKKQLGSHGVQTGAQIAGKNE